MDSNPVPFFNCSGILEYLKSVGHVPLPDYLPWLYKAPKYTTFRINTILISASEAKIKLKKFIESTENGNATSMPEIFLHPLLPDLMVLGPMNYITNNSYDNEVIVDASCGAAVLRGAHVYAPGVLGMTAGIKVGDRVNILADLQAGCRKGLKKVYKGRKVPVGTGIALMTRKNLFMEDSAVTGIAIKVTSNASGCACLPIDGPHLSSLSSLLLLQNLPSVLCGRVLKPRPGQMVLDACAAPGNKTTHLAALMSNQGLIVALDKTPTRVNIIKQNCEKMAATNVKAFVFDSTKAVVDSSESILCKNPLTDPPPFSPNTFDKVLLDVPCSALGQRPQLANQSSVSHLKSYPNLQRKLFKSAVRLVKGGGEILYSTCTITVAENEEIVAWALQSFPSLILEDVTPRIGGCGGIGWPVEGLTPELRAKVLRFGPPPDELPDGCVPCDADTVGFFLALFRKVT